MNKDDIIRMALEAGFDKDENGLYFSSGTDSDLTPALERFAAFVAAAELEKVARWMIARSYATGHGDTIEDLLEELVALAAERERKACAKVCGEIEEKCWETWDSLCDPTDQGSAIGAAHCAAAIRARGET